jgi:hypothetical protein
MAVEVISGRMSGEQATKMTMRAPPSSPAEPIPLIMRPIMKTLLDLDKAHTRLPTSNITIKPR